MLLEDMILKKMIKYMGITAATLLAVAPIAMPVISSATETTVKADAVSGVNQADVQTWLGEVKNQVTIKKGNSLLQTEDYDTFYVVGSDGIFYFRPEELTSSSIIFNMYQDKSRNPTNDLFASFNDNANKDNLFFNNDSVRVIATATANNGSISGNLAPADINKVLQSGSGVTFHVSLRYAAGDTHGWWDFAGDKMIATTLGSKNVVVTAEGCGKGTDNNTNNGTNQKNNQTTETTAPGSSYSGAFSPSVDAKLYDDKGVATSAMLPKFSAWKMDRQMTLNGVTYYRVANNEWIKKSDGLEVFPVVQTVTTKQQAQLYTSTGKLVTDRALAPNTAWYSDRSAEINGQYMHRVATNEWVAASNIK